jgi:hypothetical protein
MKMKLNISWPIRIAIGLVAFAATILQPSGADAKRGFLSSFAGRAAGHAAGAAVGSGTGSATTGSATASKSYGTDVLTPTQLEACVLQARKLDEDGDRLDTEAAAVQAVADSAKTMKAGIEAEQASLNRSNKTAINRYNKRVDEYNGTLERYRVAFAAYKPKEAAFNAVVADYNGSCGKKYYPDDMQVIKAKLGLN